VVAERMKRMILRVEGYKRTQIDMIGLLRTLQLELFSIMLPDTRRLRVGVANGKTTAIYTAKLEGVKCIELMMLDHDESPAN
jgi:hypothetical protein